MKRNSILTKIRAMLIAILILSLVFAFVSCSDDIVGPQIRDKDEEQDTKEDGTGEDPNNDGGTVALNNGVFLVLFDKHC